MSIRDILYEMSFEEFKKMIEKDICGGEITLPDDPDEVFEILESVGILVFYDENELLDYLYDEFMEIYEVSEKAMYYVDLELYAHDLAVSGEFGFYLVEISKYNYRIVMIELYRADEYKEELKEVISRA